MYVPRHFALPEELASELLAAPGAGELITQHADGLVATHLPYLHDPEANRLILHVARNNSQCREPALGESLFLITTASEYISSTWYPSAPREGTWVPTWDYLTIHLYGDLIVHDDPAWTRQAVDVLMARHETSIGLGDMDPTYLAGQLRAIVGLELRIRRIEGKAKLSQNRSVEDVLGAIDGLRAAGAIQMAELVERYALPAARAKAELVDTVARRHRGLG